MPPRIGLHRYIASGTLALLHLAVAAAYTFELTGPPPAVPGRVSVVLFIDTLGPTWRIAFGVTGLALLVALRYPRWLPYAHSLAAAPCSAYAVALWLGFAFSAPPKPSIIGALLATAVTVWHPTVGVVYMRWTSPAQDVSRIERVRRRVRRDRAV